MTTDLSWKILVDQELNLAENARAEGNEGKARVCARRAAGMIIGEYLSRQSLPIPGPSAFERLKFLRDMPEIEPKAREIAQHLLLRVNPDYTLPSDVDLIEETHSLSEILLET